MIKTEIRETPEQKARSMEIIEAEPGMLELHNGASEAGKLFLRQFLLLSDADQCKVLEMMLKDVGGANERG